MIADDFDLAYTLEELAAAEEFFGVNLFDLIEQPDPRVKGEVTCTFTDASSQIDATDLTVNVAIVL